MPLKDLLWACPLCHGIEALAADGRCTACGAIFRRTRGARIAVRPAASGSAAQAAATAGSVAATADAPETPVLERSAPEWLEQLPWPDLDGEGLMLPAGLEPPFSRLVQVRTAGQDLPLRRAGSFLGLVERFGRPVTGTLHLDRHELRFEAGEAADRGHAAQQLAQGWRWPLTSLTAIQPASSAIQLKAAGHPVVSVRFEHGSVRLWEQRLKYCTRLAWRAAGRGEITEFQPRIRTG